jgi:2-(1,2-epoxy-1,2-dihydrophenyl)acetyl-CoA isomerase
VVDRYHHGLLRPAAVSIAETRVGSVAEIALDLPEVRNALGPQGARDLRSAIDRANRDLNVGAIVLSARGKAFCSGGNLPEILELAEQGDTAITATIYKDFQGLFRLIGSSRVPIIGAVDGPAIGVGCDLALSANVTFIGRRGWLAQGWIHAGLIPATGGTLYASQRGGGQAVWRLLTADRVDGPTAEQWGLGIACEDARESALAMAKNLASLPRQALEAVLALSRIHEREEHLACALEFQRRFITDPTFAERARQLLAR